MSKPKGYPHQQPFCVKANKNLTKTKSWLQRGNTNNRVINSNKQQ